MLKKIKEFLKNSIHLGWMMPITSSAKEDVSRHHLLMLEKFALDIAIAEENRGKAIAAFQRALAVPGSGKEASEYRAVAEAFVDGFEYIVKYVIG